MLCPISLAPLRARDTVGTARPHISAMLFSVGRPLLKASFSSIPMILGGPTPDLDFDTSALSKIIYLIHIFAFFTC